MPIIPPELAAKLDPLIRMLASSVDAEVIASARALERRLRASRLDLNDFADALGQSAKEPPHHPRRWRDTNDESTEVDWRALREFCMQHKTRLRERELEFISSLDRWRGSLTPKQHDWLAAIAARLKRTA